VVTHDVAANTVVGGVPARVIRTLDGDCASRSEQRGGGHAAEALDLPARPVNA
jgi:hypothetical protein